MAFGHTGGAPPPPSPIFGIFLLFAYGLSHTVEVLQRKNFGERYVTVTKTVTIFLLGIGCCLFIESYSGAWPPPERINIYNHPWHTFYVQAYFWLFLAVAAFRWLQIRWRGVRRGRYIHSYFNGDPPRLFKWLPGKLTACVIEPGMVALLGWLMLHTLDPYATAFCYLVAFCHACIQLVGYRYDHHRKKDLEDAFQDQDWAQDIARRWRDR